MVLYLLGRRVDHHDEVKAMTIIKCNLYSSSFKKRLAIDGLVTARCFSCSCDQTCPFLGTVLLRRLVVLTASFGGRGAASVAEAVVNAVHAGHVGTNMGARWAVVAVAIGGDALSSCLAAGALAAGALAAGALAGGASLAAAALSAGASLAGGSALARGSALAGRSSLAAGALAASALAGGSSLAAGAALAGRASFARGSSLAGRAALARRAALAAAAVIIIGGGGRGNSGHEGNEEKLGEVHLVVAVVVVVGLLLLGIVRKSNSQTGFGFPPWTERNAVASPFLHSPTSGHSRGTDENIRSRRLVKTLDYAPHGVPSLLRSKAHQPQQSRSRLRRHGRTKE
jgi:hypothetical protein